MGIIRSKSQWQCIFEDQKASGLTIIGYCREHQLSTATFYTSRKKLSSTPNHFVRAKITQQVELIAYPPVIELSIGQTKVTLPSTTTASYLGQVLRELN
jgi:putative transposase